MPKTRRERRVAEDVEMVAEDAVGALALAECPSHDACRPAQPEQPLAWASRCLCVPATAGWAQRAGSQRAWTGLPWRRRRSKQQPCSRESGPSRGAWTSQQQQQPSNNLPVHHQPVALVALQSPRATLLQDTALLGGATTPSAPTPTLTRYESTGQDLVLGIFFKVRAQHSGSGSSQLAPHILFRFTRTPYCRVAHAPQYLMWAIAIGPWKAIRAMSWLLNKWQRFAYPVSFAMFYGAHSHAVSVSLAPAAASSGPPQLTSTLCQAVVPAAAPSLPRHVYSFQAARALSRTSSSAVGR
jgi:hypothetical protein